MKWILILSTIVSVSGCAFKQAEKQVGEGTSITLTPQTLENGLKEYVAIQFASGDQNVQRKRAIAARDQYGAAIVQTPLTLPDRIPNSITVSVPKANIAEQKATTLLRALVVSNDEYRTEQVVPLKVLSSKGEDTATFELSGLQDSLKALSASGKTLVVELLERGSSTSIEVLRLPVRLTPRAVETKIVKVSDYVKIGEFRKLGIIQNRWVSMKQERAYALALLEIKNNEDVEVSISLEQLSKSKVVTSLEQYNPTSLGCGFSNNPFKSEQLLTDKVLFLPLNPETEAKLSAVLDSASLAKRVSVVITPKSTSTWVVLGVGDRSAYRQPSQIQNVSMVARCDWACDHYAQNSGTLSPPGTCAGALCEEKYACWDCNQGNSARCGLCKQEDDRRYSFRIPTYCHNYAWSQKNVYADTKAGVEASTIFKFRSDDGLAQLRHADASESEDPEFRILQGALESEVPLE